MPKPAEGTNERKGNTAERSQAKRASPRRPKPAHAVDNVVGAIGPKIRELRLQRGLSLQQLADRSGVSPAAIHKIERNGMVPTIATLMKLAVALNRPVSFLIDEATPDGPVALTSTGAGRPAGRPTSRPTMLTWGLIGPGKGIERMLDAMPALHRLPMRPRYLVAGRTHPKVLASHGESYRDARIDQARRLGVSDSVRFDDDYRDMASLNALIASSAVVVLPYDSTEQVTSGVLVDAIAAGKPVVATAFPHAVELLSSGAGIVVDHNDPDAMAGALRRVLLEPGLAAHMAAEAARLAPALGWPVVAQAYLTLARPLLVTRPVLV